MSRQDSDDFQQWLNDNIDESEYLQEIEDVNTDLNQLVIDYPKVLLN